MAGGALRKGLIWAGLADDGLAEIETPVDHTETTSHREPRETHRSGGRDYAPQPQPAPAESYAEVTPIRAAQGFQSQGSGQVFTAVTPQPAPGELRRITTIHPRSYNDARLIGEAFRAGTPVIMNLSDMSDDDGRRLVDFSSGLIFGLYGGIERVTPKVWLLSPEHIEVVGKEEVEASESNGGQFYNQS